MRWKTGVCLLSAVLLCTSVLVVGANADNPAERARGPAHGTSAADQISANPVPVTGVEKRASLPEGKRTEEYGFTDTKEEKESGAPVELEPTASIMPLGLELGRAACVGDKDINGAGTTNFNMPLGTYYKDGRTQSIYLASEFGCDGGPISGMRYYVSVVPGQALNSFMIRMRHTALSAYATGATFDTTGWTIVYGPTTLTISATGWYTFTFTAPFTYNGTSNLEVDVTFNNSTYTSDGQVYSFSASPNYRTIYKRCDDCACPTGGPTNAADWGPTCTTSVTRSYNVPRAQFIFPAPSTGACCVNYVCVATNTEPDCTALSGTWFGGQSCPAFFCPPWNDNCGAVTPVTLDAGVPVTFTGDNRGATNDCGSFPGGQVWHAITLPATYAVWDVTLDYCTTVGPFGNAWLNLGLGCPCTGYTAAGTWDVTTCGDGNITIRWAGLAAGTYYYPVLLDAANNAAGPYTLNVVANPGYCESRATSTADETIKNVTLNTINNTTVDCDTYNNFTSISTAIDRGSSYALSITIGDCEGTSCYTKRASVYIDWNQDYDFVDAGEKVYGSGQLANTPCPDMTITGSITVPLDAALGPTRMRVIVIEGTVASDPSSCGTYTWGATEDYTVDIQPAPPTGACCMPPDFATCQDGSMTEAQCLTAGGIYQGDGSVCVPNPCVGACCSNDGLCAELTEADCTGVYQGDGTDCDPNPCPQPGACCVSDGTCYPSTVVAPGDCAAGDTYLSDNTVCTPNPCPQPGDACANPVLIVAVPYSTQFDNNNALAGAPSCNTSYTVTQNDWWFSYTPAADCYLVLDVAEVTSYDMVMGIYTGPDCNTLTNIVCLDDPEPYHVEFAATGGTTYWFQIGDYGSGEGGGVTNFSMDCQAGIPEGACCAGIGSCWVMTAADCATAGGTYQGNDTVCDPNPCPQPGACCGATCYMSNVVAPGDCVAGDLYIGDNTDCDPDPCPIEVGESCPVAYVIPAVPATVTFNNDLYTADGTTSCHSYQPMYNDGWMSYTPTADCLLTLGVTDLTSYDMVMSVYSGPDCNTLTELVCVDDPEPYNVQIPATAGTTYWFQIGDYGSTEGGGLTKVDLACSSAAGACCLCGDCQVLTQSQCLLAGGDFQGDNTVCDPNPCPTPVPGNDCCDPLAVNIPADLPYTDAAQTTCGRGNDYADTCLGSYDGGEDIVYELTVTGEAICVDITATGADANNNWIGVGVDDVCPLGNPCMAAVGVSGTVATISGLVLVPGTYYVMVDTWPSPTCLTNFTLTITESTACAEGACCQTTGCTVEFQQQCNAVGGAFAGNGTVCSGQDCNANGVDDLCDILGGMADCQPDGIPDVCQLAGNDLDGNGVPDECDPDCNNNGIPDACDVSCAGACASVPGCGQSADCQPNGTPDECELGRVVRYTYQVDDGTHENSIGLTNGGEIAWMNRFVVVGGAESIISISIAWASVPNGTAATVLVWSDPNGDGDPTDAQVISQQAATVANTDTDVLNVLTIPAAAVGPAGTSFFAGAMIAHAAGQYPASVDQNSVLNGQSWIAGDTTYNLDPNNLGGGDVPPINIDTIAGLEGNWLIRAEGGAAGADCNNNGVPDDCDIAGGTSDDCQPDGIPDECQLDGNDCDADGVPDDCQLAGNDCNANDIPDNCDIAQGTSNDCQPDGIPDECQLDGGTGALLIDEGFDDITNLPGWFMQNNSDPLGSTDWFQGNSSVFPGQAGGGTSYIGANFNNTGDNGNISNWLLTPVVNLQNGMVWDFYTRGPTCTTCWADRLQVRMSLSGASTDVGATWDSVGVFTTLLLDVNPTYIPDGYPQTWDAGHFTVTLSGIATPTNGRLALRYFVEDGGYYGTNSNYIGIDTVTLTGEPGLPSNDCNTNGIPDDCDLAAGTSHDFNGNGVPDECEGFLCGDLDYDGDVDPIDYWLFVDAYGHCVGDPKYRADADYNTSGCIGLPDYQAWIACYRAYVGNPYARPPVRPHGGVSSDGIQTDPKNPPVTQTPGQTPAPTGNPR